MKVTISKYDLMREMLNLPIPFEQSLNIAVASAFQKVGLRFTRTSLFGLTEPVLDPPWEIVPNFQADGWDITQHSSQDCKET
jgi:hypothetical protein